MRDWIKLIGEVHAQSHGDSMELVTQPGARPDILNDLATRLEIEFPDEFVELYSVCNGSGIRSPGASDACWFFRPAEEIIDFTEQLRGWFSKTHGKFASRFVPFIDFMNGDGIGYGLDADRSVIDGLICFEHERYRFDADQDVNEFLVHKPASIADFLNSCISVG